MATSRPILPRPIDAERLVGELDALPLRALPAALDQRGVGLGDVAGLGHQHGEGVLGRGEDVRLRRVDHHHPAGGRHRHVDVVEPDAGPADHHQVGARRQHVRGDLGGGPHDQRVRAGDGREQLGGGKAQTDVDLVAGVAEAIEPDLRDLLRDQDASHALSVEAGPDGLSTPAHRRQSGTTVGAPRPRLSVRGAPQRTRRDRRRRPLRVGRRRAGGSERPARHRARGVGGGRRPAGHRGGRPRPGRPRRPVLHHPLRGVRRAGRGPRGQGHRLRVVPGLQRPRRLPRATRCGAA